MKYKNIYLAFLLAVGFIHIAFAQAPAFKEISFPVIQNNITLPSPFAGGLNSPQFNAADLNNERALRNIQARDHGLRVFFEVVNQAQ